MLFSVLVTEQTNRSSHQRCSVIKGVLRNFAKFTGKHLCQSPFLNKVAGMRPATLLRKRLWHRRFPVNFKNTFFTEHLWWLLLEKCYIISIRGSNCFNIVNRFYHVTITLVNTFLKCCLYFNTYMLFYFETKNEW